MTRSKASALTPLPSRDPKPRRQVTSSAASCLPSLLPLRGEEASGASCPSREPPRPRRRHLRPSAQALPPRLGLPRQAGKFSGEVGRAADRVDKNPSKPSRGADTRTKKGKSFEGGAGASGALRGSGACRPSGRGRPGSAGRRRRVRDEPGGPEETGWWGRLGGQQPAWGCRG